MESEEISTRLEDTDYVAKVIIRGDPERPLSDDEALAIQQRMARAIVQQMIVVRRTKGFKQRMEKTRLGEQLKNYVNTYTDSP